MSAPRSKRAVGIIAVVVAIVIGLGVSCNGFREDEIECEQAVAHLTECCGSAFSPRALDCSYHESLDCSDNVVAREYPALALEDSRCVQKKSCSELIKTGDCERARTAKQRIVAVDAAASPPPQPPVCQ